MTLSDCANLALIVCALAGVASVFLLSRELRENNRLVRAANTQTLVELSSPFYLSMMQDRQMASIYIQGATNYAKMDEVDKYRYKSLLTWWLVFHENVYYQWRNGLLDEHSYRPWAEDLKHFVRQQDLRQHWKMMKGLFQDGFTHHMEQVLADAGPRRPE